MRTRTVVELSRDGSKYVFHRLRDGKTLNHPGDRDAERRCPVCAGKKR